MIERLCVATPDDAQERHIYERALERYLEIVSEASRHIPEELTKRHPDIPWRRIADFGNALRHAYDRIDSQRIAVIVERDLPRLKAAIREMYREAKAPTDPWPGADPDPA